MAVLFDFLAADFFADFLAAFLAAFPAAAFFGGVGHLALLCSRQAYALVRENLAAEPSHPAAARG